ncbi:restriction endonuclease subunit S [Streptomyces sp. SID2563]|uniref:restriction endonuclease subunit S n=1 Tax=Streptomyces sp. SID2563 TaxID=2690255 RepID=UPI00136B22B7|nr:restriction endonuclease subunit S [Streptomyces sp. SID2563]MYW10789.1 restriction endonuclease subunit S [Streptomyces sp. SID2563]
MALTTSPQELVAVAEASEQAGLLSRHPSWERVPLGEIADVLNGFAFKSHSFNRVGDGLPLIRIRDVVRGTTETYYSGSYEPQYLVESGDIIVGMDGDFRVSTWRGPTALLNQRVCKVTVRDKGHYDPRFLVCVLQGYLDAIGAATSSVTVKHLSSRSMQEIPLPLPPLAEQHRIVEALEDHLSRLEAAERLATQATVRARRLRESVSSITHGFNVPSVEVPAAPPAPGGTDDGLLPRIPSTWSWKRLEEIADVVGGVTKDNKRQSDPNLPEVPYLRVANVQRGWLDLSEVSVIRVPEKKAIQLSLRTGDVLLNEGGDRDKLGRGWIWEGQVEGAIHQNHVFRARVRDDYIHPKLLSWYANSAARWFDANGKQSVNLASISLSKIKKLPVPVPPLAEQGAIVERIEDQLSVLDAAISFSRQALSKAKALRRSLLVQAFEGRLVLQDPADEPASVLLDRIRAEREAQGNKPKRATRRPRKATNSEAPDAPPSASSAPATTAVQQELPL